MMKKIIGSILCLSLIVSLLCQTSLAADDTVKLTGNKTVDATIVIETNTVYDLNGYTLALAAGTSGSVFYIKGGATLKVMPWRAAPLRRVNWASTAVNTATLPTAAAAVRMWRAARSWS